jgi:hypothetical protein
MISFLKGAMRAVAADPTGRFIGTTGNQRAEAYLEGLLRDLGARVRKHSFVKEISLASSCSVEYRTNGSWIPLAVRPGIGTTSLQSIETRSVFVDHGAEEDYAGLGARMHGKVAVARLWKTHETAKLALAGRERAAAILWYNEYVDDLYSAACDYVESVIPGISIRKSDAQLLIHERPTLRIAVESSRQRIPGSTIIADLGEGTPKIVLSAHYDTRPETPGANDDASGVVCCLGLAKALKQTRRLAENVRIILFDAEETGCYGSENYVHHLIETGTIGEVSAVINFDSVGWPNLAILEADREASLSEELCGKVATIAREKNYAMVTTRSRSGKSDHTPFARNGVPAVWFSDYPNYLRHSPQDTVDNIDYRTILNVIDVVTELLKSFQPK